MKDKQSYKSSEQKKKNNASGHRFVTLRNRDLAKKTTKFKHIVNRRESSCKLTSLWRHCDEPNAWRSSCLPCLTPVFSHWTALRGLEISDFFPKFRNVFYSTLISRSLLVTQSCGLVKYWKFSQKINPLGHSFDSFSALYLLRFGHSGKK